MRMSEKTTLIALDIAFVGIATAAASQGQLPKLEGSLFLAALGMASFRAGRAVAFNLIFEWLRELFGVVELPDSSGAGNNNHAQGSGPKKIMGELLTCPICSATWAAIILVLVNSIWPALGQVLIMALAAAGIAELAHWASEAMQWSGRLSREIAGMYNRNSQSIYVVPEVINNAKSQ